MDLIPRDLAFYNDVVENTEMQLTKKLKDLSPGQYSLLQKLAVSVLDDTIPMTSRDLHLLEHYVQFVRRLAQTRKMKSDTLIRNMGALTVMAQMALRHHEARAESSFTSQRRLGQDKKQREHSTTQRVGDKVRDYSNSSSEEDSADSDSDIFSSDSTETESESEREK